MLDRSITAVVALTLLALWVVGCGPADKPVPAGLVPVSGTVTMDGKGLNGATVMFIPTSGQAVDAGGLTDEAGKYELKSGEGKGTGALPGEYRVVVTRLTKPDGSVVPPSPEKSPMQLMTEENAKESVPAQYSDLLRSKLKATVAAGGGTHDFPLKSK